MPHNGLSQWLQATKFSGIFLFWLDESPFFRVAGVQLFFENCYWRG